MVVLVATDRLTGDSINVTEPVDPGTHQHGVDGRGGDTELARDLHRPHNGEIIDSFAHISDLYPTFADYTGADITDQPELLGATLCGVFEGADGDTNDESGSCERWEWRRWSTRSRSRTTPSPGGWCSRSA